VFGRRGTIDTCGAGIVAVLVLLLVLPAVPGPAIHASAPPPHRSGVHPITAAARAAEGNSSQVVEAPTVVATVPAQEPYAGSYDAVDNLTYIPQVSNDSVLVLDGNLTVGTVPLPCGPLVTMYDPADRFVWASCEYSDTPRAPDLALINGTSVVATEQAGRSTSLAYDPVDGDVYGVDIDADPGVARVFNATTAAPVGNVSTGTYPAGVAFDPVNGLVYVTSVADSGNGGNYVTVIRNLSVVGKVAGNLTTPLGVAVDDTDGWVYVTDDCGESTCGYVTVINGSRELGEVGTGENPWGATYDPATGRVYVANRLSGNLTVLQGERSVGKVSVGAQPVGVTLDPEDDLLYVSNLESNDLSIVASSLREGPIAPSPVGDPSGSSDVGTPVLFTTSVEPAGIGRLTARASVDPAQGLGCQAPALFEPVLGRAVVRSACTSTEPGDYALTINVTDSRGRTVWAELDYVVFPPLAADVPGVLDAAGEPVAAADVGQPLVFTEAATGGSGNYTDYAWYGLPAANCTGLDGPQPTCVPPAPLSASVEVIVTDSEGAQAVSGARPFTVDALPEVGAPTASRPSADVGQSIAFNDTLSAPAGLFMVSWGGLEEADCNGTLTPVVSCVFPYPGTFEVFLDLEDRNAVSVISPATVVTVDPRPSVAAPRVGPGSTANASADVGQTVGFAAAAGGGSPPYSYGWSGLPGPCTGATGPDPVCEVAQPGRYFVRSNVTDANGGTSDDGPSTPFVAYPDPVVSTPAFDPAIAVTDGTVAIAATVSGGAPGDTYRWFGLPPGCGGTGSSLSCTPSAPGDYSIWVVVTDGDNETTHSGVASLVVATPTAAPPALAPLVLPAATVAVAGAVVAAVLIGRMRRGGPPPHGP
jgi:DNA-binding beta-propeller fold protein YncE